MEWEDVPQVTDDWVLQLAAPAFDLRKVAADILTVDPVGYYALADSSVDQIGLFSETGNQTDLYLCKAAAEKAVGTQVRPLFLSYQSLTQPDAKWVKVAYSPTLRQLGEHLNFFPGQLPGGIPNTPHPLAAMLTSGLVGAGLGYGTGKLLGAVLPQDYGKRLGRTGALVGGALGAMPGAVWGMGNVANGKSLTDGWPFDKQPGDQPEAGEGGWINGNNATKLGSDVFDAIQLGQRYLTAVENFIEKLAGDTFGVPRRRLPPTPIDVNINALGQTLWDVGASPQLASTTMGAMYAAQQLPDPNSRPGWATGRQLGQLAANTAGGYGTGLLVGATINTLIGTPLRTSAFGAGGAILGALSAVVPKLFGG